MLWRIPIVVAALAALVVPAFGASLAPDLELSPGWYARIDTSMGRIVIRLLPDQAPNSVAHFVAFANGELEWMDPITGEMSTAPLFDGVAVQKSLADQRFELGTRRSDGKSFPWRYVPEEGTGPVNFFRDYTVGMTQTDSGRIAAHQFFITAAPQPFLTPGYPCFGYVVDGKPVVREITNVTTYDNDRPVEPITIERVRAFSVGSAGELPEIVEYWPKQEAFQMRGDRTRRHRLNPARAPKSEEDKQN